MSEQVSPPKQPHYELDDLLYLMARLRTPLTGCPWDLKQNYKSIAPSTLEEAYEVVDAIERDDYDHLKEELGDLLFQVVFYAQLANEEERYTFSDIVNDLTAKLVRRHPHVFPEGELKRVNEANESAPANPNSHSTIQDRTIREAWEALKETERKEKGNTALFADVPLALSALKRSSKLQKRAARVGFDWPSYEGALTKIKEETRELECAIQKNDQENIKEELGDLLFSCVNLSRHLHIDAEQSLRLSNRKFEERINWIDSKLTLTQSSWAASSEADLDQLWEQAKKHLHVKA